MEKTNNKIILIVVLATIFGMLSGLVGAVIARVYVLEKAFNVPLFGEINLSGDMLNSQRLIIRDAKKVIVEQNSKVQETINSAGNSIAAIFEKKKTTNEKPDKSVKNIIESAYNLKNEIGQGLIITSDGWIISSYTPKAYSSDIATKTRESVIDNYVIIDSNKKVYSVENIILDTTSNYSFWKIKANDLPVKAFAETNNIHNGQLVLAVNWDGSSFLSTIVEKNEKDKKLYKTSDNFFNKIKLSAVPDDNFFGSFVFNLNNDLVALINNEGEIRLISDFAPCINCLLSKREIKYPELGINYLDLSEFLFDSKNIAGKGALLYPDEKGIAIKVGSPAEKIGLKNGDIILSINDILIDEKNKLEDIMKKFFVNDEILIKYLRDGKEFEVKIQFD
ncbi:PDZ domain-containing protein [Candidatus Parcubacteria bacterium]|nr:PDZ domain-containing protein [Candidatus Parcubacteria bacterium]